MKKARYFSLLFAFLFAILLITGTLAFAQSASKVPTQASITFSKTVGTNPAQCATTKYIISLDGNVTYCFKVTNTGPVTLTVHDLTDTDLGVIFANLSYTLTPGASYFITQTVELTQTTVNTATWVASNPALSEVISATDFASVNVLATCPLGYLPKRYEYATFNTFPPAGWSTTYTSTSCTGVPGWTNTDLRARGNLTGAGGSFAIADSGACSPGGAITATMSTMPLDLTGIDLPQLVFFTDYQNGDPLHGTASVDVSTDAGSTWAPLLSWNESHPGPLIITDFLPGAGEDDVMVRWQLTNAMTNTWWEVDNVSVVVCQPRPAEIEVTPNSISSIQAPDQQSDHYVQVSNGGTLDLEWSMQVANPSTSVESPFVSNQPTQEILYDQTDFSATTAIPSQAFDPSDPSFDNQAADDFVVPASAGAWAIELIDVPGAYLTGTEQIPYANIFIYADAGGLPGTAIYTATHIKPFNDASGDLTFNLRIPAVLPAGTYWLSVQAQTFGTSSIVWGWTERTEQMLSASAWRNPGGGLGTLCTDWGARAGTCNVGTQPDLSFRLLGVASNCAPSELSWASVSPLSGITPAGVTDIVAVTLDSTGLNNGIYQGQLCTISNDPLIPFINIPLELTVVDQPFLQFDKTVGTDPSVCATTASITVPMDTDVTYCYKITNTGTVSLTTHDLVDNRLGTLLDAEPILVNPGASTFITITANIREDTVNTATWTAYTEVGLYVSAQNNAVVFVETPTPTPTFTPTPSQTPSVTPPPDNTSYVYLPIIYRDIQRNTTPQSNVPDLKWFSMLLIPAMFVGLKKYRTKK